MEQLPADVLPAFVAEMDFPLARPVREAPTRAIELNDTGYANPEASGLAKAFAGFAGWRWDWEVEPTVVARSPAGRNPVREAREDFASTSELPPP